jgi:hypothetical protein
MGDRFIWAAVTALAANGLLAGASLDQSIKQLPARRAIGAVAYAAFARAADGGNGIPWYAALGVGSAAITIATAVAAMVTGQPRAVRGPAVAAGLLSLAHSFTTSRAAPIMLGLRHAREDEGELAKSLDRFERWQTVRVATQVATLAAAVAVTAAASRRRRD